MSKVVRMLKTYASETTVLTEGQTYTVADTLAGVLFDAKACIILTAAQTAALKQKGKVQPAPKKPDPADELAGKSRNRPDADLDPDDDDDSDDDEGDDGDAPPAKKKPATKPATPAKTEPETK